MGIRCADHVSPLYPQKLALTSPTGGGRSVGIVRSRTKATEEEEELPIQPVLVAPRSKAKVCGRSPAEIVGSNHTGGLGCLSVMSVVYCQVEVSATS